MTSGMKVFKFILLAIAGVLVFAYIVYLLWNSLMPDLFQLKTITYLQALGILVLSKILFGGFRGAWNSGGKWKQEKKIWRERMEAKMANMTAEEKEKFKRELANRCGCDCNSESNN